LARAIEAEVEVSYCCVAMKDAGEVCASCGGDGYIQNAGSRDRCPSCRGSGRRVPDEGFRDVTKTKPSHYLKSNQKAAAPPKPTAPTTFEGGQLASEVRDSKIVSQDVKDRLIREIMEHESTHGQCTQTFIKKVRKQVRPKA
jgi:hypothetical protein